MIEYSTPRHHGRYDRRRELPIDRHLARAADDLCDEADRLREYRTRIARLGNPPHLRNQLRLAEAELQERMRGVRECIAKRREERGG